MEDCEAALVIDQESPVLDLDLDQESLDVIDMECTQDNECGLDMECEQCSSLIENEICESLGNLDLSNCNRFCQDCPTFPEKGLCDVCGMIVCQYCQGALWLISDIYYYGLLKLSDVTRPIHTFNIQNDEDVYFMCSSICQRKLFSAIINNKLDKYRMYRK